MRLLLELQKFEDVITRGRFKGDKSVYKLCITGDNYCWHVSRHNYNDKKGWYHCGASGCNKYSKGFVHLLSSMCFFGINPLDHIERIVKELEKRNGNSMSDDNMKTIKSLMSDCGDIAPEVMSEINRKRSEVRFLLEKIGNIIDSEFRTNYNILEHSPINASDPDCIFHRIFSKKDDM